MGRRQICWPHGPFCWASSATKSPAISRTLISCFCCTVVVIIKRVLSKHAPNASRRSFDPRSFTRSLVIVIVKVRFSTNDTRYPLIRTRTSPSCPSSPPAAYKPYQCVCYSHSHETALDILNPRWVFRTLQFGTGSHFHQRSSSDDYHVGISN